MKAYCTNDDTTGFYFINRNSLSGKLNPGDFFNLYKTSTSDTLNGLHLVNDWSDEQLSYHHYKYIQNFKGIDIEGAEYLEHHDDSGLVFSNAKFVAIPDTFNITPNIPEYVAMNALYSYLINTVGVIQFAWDNSDYEHQIQIDLNDTNASYHPQGELIITADSSYKYYSYVTNGKNYRLAYRFKIYSLTPYFLRYYYVDAQDETILKYEELIRDNGPANIHHHGTNTIDTQWKGGLIQKYILYADDYGHKIHTKDYSQSPWWLISNIKDKDDNWGSSFHGSTCSHWFVTKAWDYFKLHYGRNGINGNNGEIRVMSEREGYNGAYYTPDVIPYIVLGTYYARCVDVVGHEYFHGITDNTAQLSGSYEPGALSESYSDIFGTLIESYTQGLDWIVGDDELSNNIVVRNMSDPNIEGKPDTYHDNLYWSNSSSDYGGIHHNCSVQNYWFYLLVNGGTGINSINNSYNISGIGSTKAGKIAYYALTNILSSNSQYVDSRNATITAAKLLFGECSNEDVQTTNAWYAVGVGNYSYCWPMQVVDKSDILIKADIYPIPADEIINIKLKNNDIQNKKYTITLTSIFGNEVYKQNASNETLILINTKNLSSGIYILKITDKNAKHIINRKIVINHG